MHSVKIFAVLFAVASAETFGFNSESLESLVASQFGRVQVPSNRFQQPSRRISDLPRTYQQPEVRTPPPITYQQPEIRTQPEVRFPVSVRDFSDESSEESSEEEIFRSVSRNVVRVETCQGGRIRDALGNCVEPIVTRKINLYHAPQASARFVAASRVPTPKVNYNYVFLRTNNAVVDNTPVVVPPAQQKTLVYLLNKDAGTHQQEVIEVQGSDDEPEVFVVNYQDGVNQQLPGGIDLRTALSQSQSVAPVIDAGAGVGGRTVGDVTFRDDSDSDSDEDDLFPRINVREETIRSRVYGPPRA